MSTVEMIIQRMFQKHTRVKQLGFTLIELSIAIVIIAVIAGGILLGQDLLDAARTRSQLSQIEEYSTAVRTFKLKYNCLPGDCKDAVAYGLGSNAAYHNGNGNDTIAQTTDVVYGPGYGSADAKESENFFMHLARSGLISGDFTGYYAEALAGSNIPTVAMLDARYPRGKAPFISQTWVFPARFLAESTGNTARDLGQGFAILSHGTLSGGRYFALGNHPKIGFQMDSKIDDGLPVTGNVGNGVPYTGLYNAAEDTAIGSNCYGAAYNVNTTATTSLCRMLFGFRF